MRLSAGHERAHGHVVRQRRRYPGQASAFEVRMLLKLAGCLLGVRFDVAIVVRASRISLLPVYLFFIIHCCVRCSRVHVHVQHRPLFVRDFHVQRGRRRAGPPGVLLQLPLISSTMDRQACFDRASDVF